jgi:enediyne biosynthesis protein E4
MRIRKISYKHLFTLAVLLVLFSCDKPQGTGRDTLFQLLPASATGIDFKNTVTDTDQLNIFNYHNFYNGGGVAIGDINNDGLADVFFTSNQHGNKLYLNKGNWQFEDITARAAVGGAKPWRTGVTMADVNADGWLDIYVSNAGLVSGNNTANELFINQQNGTFKEEAARYGLDDKGQSTQAVFFDYDHDSDLDCYVLNNSQRSFDSFGYDSSLRHVRDPLNGHKLYRNDNMKFIDVSAQAGIYGSEIAFGLGVSVGDVNNDGWEDIYVCNDFFEKDYLYLNQQNGTFKEVIDEAIGHISQGAMGVDIADINNDGWMDIFTTEMLPETDQRLKTTIKFDEIDIQNFKNRLSFHQQLTANCLQLNNADGTFSEIAQLSGLDATSWSWSVLQFDFDNDGWKDIYVCNGLKKDLTDQDFLEYFNTSGIMNEVAQRKVSYKDLLVKLPSVPLPNYAFVNQKDLRFKNASAQLGFDAPSFSNGAAYGDLDGDGDLDLVVNNVDINAFVYRNMSAEKKQHHYLRIKLKGPPGNSFGYGAKVTVAAPGLYQVLEQAPTRGFQSSVEPVLHFGLGPQTKIYGIQVRWPDGKLDVLKDVMIDTVLTFEYKKSPDYLPSNWGMEPAPYDDVAEKIFIGNYRHTENPFLDFDVEKLIPKMLSTQGPKLATADVNNDGLDDLYMGSATGDTAKLFIQQKDGRFKLTTQPAFIADKYYENIGAEFFDADGDGDADLVVAAGGNQAKQGSPYLFTRLYLNDGKGNFSKASKGWPQVSVNASCVRVGDFDNDGRQDVFIGARSAPGSYGVTPSSVLLKNMGGGNFVIADSIAPGMVTDARWVDINNDRTKELVVVGDWMPVTVYKFANRKLSKAFEIPNSSGWWNCVTVADMDNDGDEDLIAGNTGLNSRIKANKDQPARLFVDDFDNNGQTECIPVYHKTDGKPYPYHLKGELQSALPGLKKKFLRFDAYAGKTIDEVLTPAQLKRATVLSVNEQQTAIFLNDGKGNFTVKPLPLMAQLSPTFAILATDLNADSIKDLFLGGNFYGLKPQGGRFDASYGVALTGSDSLKFEHYAPSESGLFVKGEVRDILPLKTAKGQYIAVAVNDAPLYLFKRIQLTTANR